MGLRALHRRQYADYGEYHQTRRGLWLHLLGVPLVQFGLLFAVIGMPFMSWWIEVLRQWNGDDSLGWSILWPVGVGLGGLLLAALGMALQGTAHKGEPHPPVPFSSRRNAIGRILVEQFVTFPRFVFSGGWLRAWRASSQTPSKP
ncbi:MAG: terminase [Thermoplasmatota archaeon]